MAAPTDDEAVGAGTVLGGSYELEREIGRGGMGVVWEAQHLRLPKRVAVKVLSDGVTRDHDSLARFRREAEIASRLGHPHIVDVIDFGEPLAGPPFIVLELIEGVSLADLIDEGPLELDRALAIAEQIASALGAAHRVGVIHRDLKPANIMIEARPDGADHAIVLDFGVSKILGSHTVHTVTQAVLGTPGYMSPEQTKGENDRVGPHSDVFALAAIVCEMLSGQPLFTGQTPIEIAYKIVHGTRLTLPADVPKRVSKGLARALDPSVKRRTSTMTAFIQSLTGDALDLGPEPDQHMISMASEAETVRLKPTSERGTRRGGAARWPMLLGLLAIIALAVGGVWGLQSRGENAQPLAVTDDAVQADAQADAASMAPRDPNNADAAVARNPVVLDAAVPDARSVVASVEAPVRVVVTGKGEGERREASGCVLDPRDNVYRHCRNFSRGKCRQFGPACGSARSVCLYDTSDNRYKICPKVTGGRCHLFKPTPCIPPQKCMRVESGIYRTCVRVGSGRCLNFGQVCEPQTF